MTDFIVVKIFKPEEYLDPEVCDELVWEDFLNAPATFQTEIMPTPTASEGTKNVD